MGEADETATECATHAGVTAVSRCATCGKGICTQCAAYDVDDAMTCEPCGRSEEDRARGIGLSLTGLVGAGYLATLALGVVVFKSKPFIGGIAAIVAIVLGRVLQLVLRPPSVRRRLGPT